MAERGAIPEVSRIRRGALRAVGALFSPLLPDDYLEMINPLWSTQELRGRIERIEPERDNAATVVIRPGYAWAGHRPGQYLRIGVVVGGIHHWRAYSLTSPPGRPDGCITITPKLVEGGKVSPHFVRAARPGDIVRLGGVEGTFTLPDPVPPRILMISAGSGITPIICMLRSLESRLRDTQGRARRSDLSAEPSTPDIVHLHSARRPDAVIFGEELRQLATSRPNYRLEVRHTIEQGRLSPGELDDLCPDWRERETFASGPAEMLDALSTHWEAEADRDRLQMERFQPVIGGDAVAGAGGTVRFLRSGVETECDGGTPILVAGEDAGLKLRHGCRMGICHTCVGKLCSGRLRDLRTGKVHGVEGETVRICVNAPEGPVTLKL